MDLGGVGRVMWGHGRVGGSWWGGWILVSSGWALAGWGGPWWVLGVDMGL